jgi:hypothetical protein
MRVLLPMESGVPAQPHVIYAASPPIKPMLVGCCSDQAHACGLLFRAGESVCSAQPQCSARQVQRAPPPAAMAEPRAMVEPRAKAEPRGWRRRDGGATAS